MIAQPPTDDAPGRHDLVAARSSPWRDSVEHVVRHMAAAIIAGLVGGFLVGGIGGRLAMRVVALQSPDHQGLTTDDASITGEISLGGSAVLIAFVTLLGVAGGLLYLVARPLLPRRHRTRAWSAVVGVVGASMVVHADGVDYAVLGSRWVSVAMFSGLCLAYGAVTATLTERLLRDGGFARRARPGWLALSFVALVPGLLIVPAAGAAAVAVAARSTGLPPRAWGRPATILGQAALGLAALAASVDLVTTLRDLA